jgi:hypothetical protein
LDVKLGTIHGAASRATAELEAAIHDYIAVTNATPKPFRWTKTADDILASIHRFCLRTAPQPTLLTTSESAHYCTGSKRWYRLIMAGLQMVEAARPNIRQASHGLAALEPFNLKTSSRC